ncbi:MAG: tetratricopeptide repeat protein [Magnetococcales bacterium]|nr:tetratricopeptide repeat protein [Magnetococcales bacterium]
MRPMTDSGDDWCQRGILAQQRGELETARICLERAIACNRDNYVYHYNLSVVLEGLGRLAEAASGYERVIGMQPDCVQACNNLGNLYRVAGRLDEAAAIYRHALTLRPDYCEARNNLGTLLKDLGQLQDALECYRQVLSQVPGFAAVYYNIGNVFLELQKLEDAAWHLEQAVAIQPDFVLACHSLACVYRDQGRAEEAQAWYRRALELAPDFQEAAAYLLHLMMEVCDWAELPRRYAQMMRLVEAGHRVVPPFTLLGLPAGAREQRACAEAYCRAKLLVKPAGSGARGAHAAGERIRIGYCSGDMGNHPVGNLLAPVFERHGRRRLEILVYSYGPDDGSETRRRIMAGCDQFVDVCGLDDAQVAGRIEADGVGILVDLQGFTKGSRPGILARRPAPVQVVGLGYAGTFGLPGLVDYLLGDPVATPPEHAGHYCETLALLPHCLLPGDGLRRVGEAPARVQAGLPEEGFVFCSFNTPFKFNPESFDIWCRLLHAVPGSILWLRQMHGLARANFMREASRRGIGEDRIRFAAVEPTIAGHLARLSLADLALDTFPYHSHTTGLDALWSGVPMVTRAGETLAGRLGVSMLHAVGLPELVTCDGEGYFALALELAQHPQRLRAIRERLWVNRSCCPLFDTARYARDLDRLYERMWRDWRAGKKEMIVLEADGE